MELTIFQKGFNFSQDGPGNRLVYHLQGCNLHCPWCSNPEGMSFQGGTRLSVDALMDEIQRSRPMFFDGGGITLTGGEVTMQPDAVLELLKRAHGAGIHTAIETNVSSARLPELLAYLDYLIMDCKHYDRAVLREVTGGDLGVMARNLDAALAAGKKPALRIPVIGGFNAGVEHAAGFADFLDRRNAARQATVELLPYHNYGEDKWKALGHPYQMGREAFVSPDTIAAMEDVLRERGYRVVKT